MNYNFNKIRNQYGKGQLPNDMRMKLCNEYHQISKMFSTELKWLYHWIILQHPVIKKLGICVMLGIILTHTFLYMPLGVTFIYAISIFAMDKTVVTWHLES